MKLNELIEHLKLLSAGGHGNDTVMLADWNEGYRDPLCVNSGPGIWGEFR